MCASGDQNLLELHPSPSPWPLFPPLFLLSMLSVLRHTGGTSKRYGFIARRPGFAAMREEDRRSAGRWRVASARGKEIEIACWIE